MASRLDPECEQVLLVYREYYPHGLIPPDAYIEEFGCCYADCFIDDDQLGDYDYEDDDDGYESQDQTWFLYCAMDPVTDTVKIDFTTSPKKKLAQLSKSAAHTLLFAVAMDLEKARSAKSAIYKFFKAQVVDRSRSRYRLNVALREYILSIERGIAERSATVTILSSPVTFPQALNGKAVLA